MTRTRDLIEREVLERSTHATVESVRTTCSFARTERLLGQEYHGRFLIELIQNAADAWRQTTEAQHGRLAELTVVIAEGPSLIVANRGAPITAEVVIESLGHVGASTKEQGGSIGHKGIGFKSVLEICSSPQIFSSLNSTENRLAVEFDPVRAQESILRESERWAEYLATVTSIDPTDPLASIPVLRYPTWVDDVPPVVAELADRYDTIVRLPFDARTASRLGRDEAEWISQIRSAVSDLSDQIVILLDAFERIHIDDRLAGRSTDIAPLVRETRSVGATGTCQSIDVERNGEESSSWLLYRDEIPGQEELAGEIAVGVRVDPNDRRRVIPAVDATTSAPFHLYFPTRISSGTPFLLHGYFRVDAGRTGFFRGAQQANLRILGELTSLAGAAVADMVARDTVDLGTLVACVATAAQPSDDLALMNLESLLVRLDGEAWIPTAGGPGAERSALPSQVLVAPSGMTSLFTSTFPDHYVKDRVGMRLADSRLDDTTLAFVASRKPVGGTGIVDIVERLLTPGDAEIWPADGADAGFRALLDLLSALEVYDRAATDSMLENLRGDPRSRVLPVMRTDGGRDLLSVPDTTVGRAGSRAMSVMARTQDADPDLVPPRDLDLAFLLNGVLSAEAEIDRAKVLGVRPFTADNVLDRLNGIDEGAGDPEEVLRFLWSMLAKTRGVFGTRSALGRAQSAFDPGEWFWCRPGRSLDDNSRGQQQRARYLSTVRLPAEDGSWRRARELCFGLAWAEWLEQQGHSSTDSAYSDRVIAYRAMQDLAPDSRSRLAPPAVIFELLQNRGFSSEEDQGPELDELGDDDPALERHAFLLLLGVWETPPVEAFEDRSQRPEEERMPWGRRCEEAWTFGLDGWSGSHHSAESVHLGEDYRFMWPLAEMARRAPDALVRALGLGSALYADRGAARMFCPGCSEGSARHTTWRNSASSSYVSTLQLELRQEAWVVATRNGFPLAVPIAPRAAWWHPKPPAGSGLDQSPLRYLPLCGPGQGVTDDLRRLVGMSTMEQAEPSALLDLLEDLADEYVASRLPVDPATSSSAKQAFIGLHRLAYERLAQLVEDGEIDSMGAVPPAGMLCVVGDELRYVPAAEARHDDGSFATYVKHFAGQVSFAALGRDRTRTASALGVKGFEVNLRPEVSGRQEDVTDDVHVMLGDRVAELMAIAVNHSLGSQTLEITSREFAERASRLQALRVVRVDSLAVHVQVADTKQEVIIGEDSRHELFLDLDQYPPVLLHDFAGDDWTDRLRRKIAPSLAMLIRNPSYSATFALFLQHESDADRESHLQELGISSDDVDEIRRGLGAVTEAERFEHQAWFQSVVTCLGRRYGSEPVAPRSLAEPDIERALQSIGADPGLVAILLRAGGGESARLRTDEGSALRALSEAGIPLQELDIELRDQGSEGLSVSVSRRRFARWRQANERLCVAVLSRAARWDSELAKQHMANLQSPPQLAWSLDPSAEELLVPVVQLFSSVGIQATAPGLATEPVATLLALGGFGSLAEATAAIDLLYDAEEQARVLRSNADAWRRAITVVGVWVRTGAGDMRSTIRMTAEAVTNLLPLSPDRPSDLHAALTETFVGSKDLLHQLRELISDDLDALAPDDEGLRRIAEDHHISLDLVEKVERALKETRNRQARSVSRKMERLTARGVSPRVPEWIAAGGPRSAWRKQASAGKRVASVKVTESLNLRKKELGDEGEEWALAAIVAPMIALDLEQRRRAVDDVVELLQGEKTNVPFESTSSGAGAVERVLNQVQSACREGLEEEELIEALTRLLHVSKVSDGFGFDLLGVLPDDSGGAPLARCIEVKSSGEDGGFHLSIGEWELAERFHSQRCGERYAVLVVRRGRKDGEPVGMDLLTDPVGRHEAGQLLRQPDGYVISYTTDARS